MAPCRPSTRESDPDPTLTLQRIRSVLAQKADDIACVLGSGPSAADAPNRPNGDEDEEDESESGRADGHEDRREGTIDVDFAGVNFRNTPALAACNALKSSA